MSNNRHEQLYKISMEKLVKSKIRECNKSDILEHIKTQGYKKLKYEEMENDSFRVKPYLSNLNITDACASKLIVS